MTKRTDLKKIAVTAMFCAVAFLMTFVFRFKVSFLTFDLKDAVLATSSLIFGPIYGLASAFVAALLELLSVSDTGFYGFIMNFLASGTFAFVCGSIYKYKRTFTGAVTGVVFAAFCVTTVMMMANIFITPFYMGVARGEVIALIPKLFLPFNLCKTVINAALTMIIYKPVVGALRRAGAVDSGEVMKEGSSTRSVLIAVVSALILVCAILFLVLYLNGGFELF